MLPFVILASSGNLVQRDSDNLLNRPQELDEPLLAVQIGGIVGAYVIFVAIILTLLLVVGRRLRRTVQSSNYTLQVEMMKPKHPPIAASATATKSNAAFNSVDPSPVTPTNKSHGFRSWTSLTKGQHSRSNNGSVATIDHESVVAADRRRNQDQMEMLYAAVMEHDERRAAATASPVSPTDDVSLKDLSPRSPTSYQNANPFSDYAARVPEDKPLPPHPHQQPQPQYHHPPAPAVTAASPPTSPGGRSRTSRLSRISNLSLFHSNREGNNASHSQSGGSRIRSPRFTGRKHGHTVGINISSPLASPDPTSPHSDQIPLSPRFYNPTPPPLPPKADGPISRINTNNTTASQERQHRTPVPPPLNLQAATPTSAKAGRSSSSLPFREAYPQLLSAPPTKTTILERPEKQLSGPRTGLPTPYSPYMPFTPLTPLTPSRIVTKKQRKREGKENGLRALNEEDAVRSEDDMWGY